MTHDFRRIASIAAMLGAAMGGMSGGAELMPQPARRLTTAGTKASRDAYRGPRGAAGSKLWRKASEGKLGLRW